MSDIKLFRLDQGRASELRGSALAIEKKLQNLIEGNLEDMLGIRFVKSEHSTGAAHGGRIDSLGLDENGSPVIIEYKRATNENVINQGLFYLDWLVDHKGDFTLLVREQLDQKAADEIDWSAPRVVCVAGDFTRYDTHAVDQIGRNIELYRYRAYGDEFFVLELLNRPSGEKTPGGRPTKPGNSPDKTVSQALEQANKELKDRYHALDAFLIVLGDDVSLKVNKHYFAYRRIKNFACVEIQTQKRDLIVYLSLDPTTVELKNPFSRDVSNTGHFGTGDLELRIHSDADLERAKPLIERSYDGG